jgi:hypothetical protein
MCNYLQPEKFSERPKKKMIYRSALCCFDIPARRFLNASVKQIKINNIVVCARGGGEIAAGSGETTVRAEIINIHQERAARGQRRWKKID